MNTVTAINTYTNVGLETSVNSADSHKLILLLYQGAMLAISSAKSQILRKEIAAKGKSISHAIQIIGEGLKASLDINTGGELAQNLSGLYDYMIQRLLHANLKNDMDALNEVGRLLGELKEAWESINPPNATQPTQLQEPPTKHAALVYGRI
jgi:flagellar secretion chaperone FliS